MNGALEHEGRPRFRYNSRGSTPQRRDPSAVRVTCWHCGKRGHYSTDCPNPPTDRMSEPTAGPSTTMGPALPSAQPAAPHPKAGAAGHYGGPPCRSNPGPDPTVPRPSHPTHPTHLPAPPYTCFDTPTHRKKTSRFLDTVGPNQTDRTDYTHTICSSIDSTADPEPCCRLFRSPFHRIYKTRHTTFTGKSLSAATGNLEGGEPHPLARHRGPQGPWR